jgi:hypothetical protein
VPIPLRKRNHKKKLPKPCRTRVLQKATPGVKGGDIVESLYGELVTKTPELKNLEMEISVLKQSRDDSTRSFDSYNQRNQSYFNAALLDIRHINDSLLRERIKRLISGNREAYDSTILKHTLLLNVIKEKTATLNDLHIALKITRTLPLIEKFQKDNKPSTGPLKGFTNNLDKAIKTADTLINN